MKMTSLCLLRVWLGLRGMKINHSDFDLFLQDNLCIGLLCCKHIWGRITAHAEIREWRSCCMKSWMLLYLRKQHQGVWNLTGSHLKFRTISSSNCTWDYWLSGGWVSPSLTSSISLFLLLIFHSEKFTPRSQSRNKKTFKYGLKHQLFFVIISLAWRKGQCLLKHYTLDYRFRGITNIYSPTNLDTFIFFRGPMFSILLFVYLLAIACHDLD